MRKIFYFVLVLAVCAAIFGNRRFASVASAQQNSAPVLTQAEKDRRIAAKVRELTSRTTDDLPETAGVGGEVTIDLDNRFQNVMLSRIDEDGEPAAACVTSVGEANAFYGRDLETGALVASGQYRKNKSSAKLAAENYGMSAQEFDFYQNLIAQAAQNADFSTASTITIVNADGAGEGFNDATAKASEGGNNGATLGAQRLNLFNFAAAIWGAYLDSNVAISVNSQFNPLTCSASSAVLGSAGAATISRDFPNAPFASTWYHTALASKLSGVDRNGSTAEINATFNSDMDSGNCLGGRTFYYGLDNATPTGKTNLLVVLLHEMGHGLGFSSFVNGATGQFAGNDSTGRFPDIFSRFMLDRTSSKYWYQMTDAERVTSLTNAGNVLWDGANVKIASGALTNGRDASNGRVQLFTPLTYQSGSSLSHFDTAAFPNLLMEPNITTGLPLNLDLTRQQLRDIGWYRDATADMTPDTITGVQPSGTALVAGSSRTITWTNNGGFDRNVTIEISTDGGATYTTLASNVANNGSYTFTVPNTATTQGRVRVREYDFVEPVGVSAANFSIGAATAVKRTQFDYDGDGKADLSIFRPSNGTWYLQRSLDGYTGYQFGVSTDRIVPADYDGDGKTDVAVYRGGNWFVLRSRDGFTSYNFGNASDIPTPADFDGDGRAELAVYRPAEGVWYQLNLATNTVTGAQFGTAEDKPVAADYDGDGKTDLAVYRPSVGVWYLLRSKDGYTGYQFGNAADKPVPADYDGDGKTDIAVFRSSDATWYMLKSGSGFATLQWGVGSDVPAPADYDGDGKADIAVYRPSAGDWYQFRTTTNAFTAFQFGQNGDQPTTNAFVR